MKKVLSVSLASLISVSCATTTPPKIKEPVVPKPTIDGNSGIEVVKAKLVVKKDSLNHKVTDVPLTLSYPVGTTLGQICRDLSIRTPYSVVAEDQIKYLSLKSPIFGHYSLKEILNKIASQLGVFWTNDHGTIRFVQEKVIVYTFPVLSSGVVSSLYNVEEKNGLNIKDEFFKELEDAVKKVLSFEKSSGRVKTVVSYNSQQETVNSVQNLKEKNNGLERDVNSTAVLHREKNNDITVDKKNKDTEVRIKGNGVSLKSGEGAEKRERGKNLSPIVLKGDRTNKIEVKKESNNNTENLKASIKHHTEESRSSVKKQNAENSRRKVEESNLGRDVVEKTETVEINKILDGKEKVAVIPSAGELIVRVGREEEPMVDSIVKSMVRNTFDNLVLFKIYVLELNKVNKKDFDFSARFFKRAYRHEATVNLSQQSVSVSFTSLANNYLQGLAHGINVDSFINYITEVGEGKVINTSTLLSLPRTLSRIKSGIEYPYFEPETVSVGGTNPTLTYQVKYVTDGLEVRLLPTVIGNNIFVQFTAVFNQFLGYQDVQAGNMGTYKLPIQSPKVITSTVRCRPNDVIFVGGLQKYNSKNFSSSNLGVARNDQRDKEKRELFVIVQPKLIKFE